jgi:predicted nucleic acid-binding protein
VSVCVVDCSVAVKWYVPEEHAEYASRLLDGSYELHAPDLLFPEFGNTLWKKHRLGELTQPETRSILGALWTVPLETHPSELLLEAAVELAVHTARTVYDCLYVVLALLLDCPFVTADQRLVNALRKFGASLDIRHVTLL